MSIDNDKLAARKAAFARRKAAFEAKARAAAERAKTLFLARVPWQNATAVSGYMPIRTELDVLPLMHHLATAGKRLCVPVITAKGERLRFREWSPDAPMTDGPFGARVPASGDWLEPDLLIVPLVGFDRQGWRLGYGGGFYDRTLADLRAQRPTRAIAYAFAAQEMPQVPRDEFDQPMDGIVTEDEYIAPSCQS